MSVKRPPVDFERLDRHVGQRLARRRRALCLTLDELEQRIGAEPGTVADYEKGIKPIGASELMALAGILGVSVAWFFADPPPDSAADSAAAPAPENVAEAERFLTFYYRIQDPKIRRDILGLIKAAATADERAS